MNPRTNNKARESFGLLAYDQFAEDEICVSGTQQEFNRQYPILSEIDSDAVVEGVINLAQEIKAGVVGELYNQKKLWFHQLCRRVRKLVPPDRDEGSTHYAAFGLLFVDLLREFRLADQADFPHSTKEDVYILFESEWMKVKIPEGENFVSLAVGLARDSPNGFESGTYGFFLDVAFHLQTLVGNNAFAIPTSEPTAQILGMSGRAISLYIERATSQGFLKPVNKAYKPGLLARTFRFLHPATKS